MEYRNLLQPNTELSFESEQRPAARYVIESVLGVGSLCVLYLAYYLDNLGLKKYVKIKEYNPVGHHLTRKEDLFLEVPEHEQEYFCKMKDRVVQSYLVSYALFQEEHISNAISNAENIHEGYGTVYIVYAYMEGQDLARHQVKSLRDAIRLTNSVAKAIHKIHEAGYLYLDIKPENVLILDGTTDLIQLFDFDSLIPITETENLAELRITFSKGFSPIEQRSGDREKIGKYSDVYSIGALLFYLIYGTAPRASDCNRRRPYSFKKSRYDFEQYPDALGREVSNIFKNTLQSYTKDRYSDMTLLIDKLSQMEHLADPSREFVQTQMPSGKTSLIGRETELLGLKRWMDSEEPVLLVTGMGGIGKSTLVTVAVQEYKDSFDAVSYMRYHGSMMETIADDQNFCLHNMEKDPAESLSEYAMRKLNRIRKLAREDKILVVVDNYEGGLSKELINILDLGWKVIVVTRKIETCHYPVFTVEPILEISSRREVFLHYLGKQDLSTDEEEILEKMICLLNGHTLSLELLAKQIRASFLTLEEALDLIQMRGLSKVGAETILYEKDGDASYQTIREIVSSLYKLGNASTLQRDILKLLALRDIRGVEIRLFTEIAGLNSKEDINQLVRTGWISVQDERIFLHPLIREVIRNAEWEETSISMLADAVRRMYDTIETLSDVPAVRGVKLEQYLDYGRDIIADDSVKEILSSEEYESFRCCVTANLTRDAEEYILSCAENINADLVRSDRMLLKLWDISVRMLCEAGNYAKAMQMMNAAENYLGNSQVADYAWAFYYGNIETEYYDCLIYDPNLTDLQERYISCLFEVSQKAINFASESEDPKAAYLKAEFISDYANFLIRMQGDERDQIIELLSLCVELFKELPKRAPETEIGVYLAYMWFYTIYDNNYEEAIKSWDMAEAVADEIVYPDLERIDALIVPRAEIEVDFAHYDAAMEWLNSGIALCDSHQETAPYQRKKEELLDHIQDVIFIKES